MYTKTDIISSARSYSTTGTTISALEGVQSGVPTRTTPTLTPTTLRNIEQLLEIPNVPPEVHCNQAGFVPPPVQPATTTTYIDSKSWGGCIVTLSSASKENTGSPPLDIASNMPVLNSTPSILSSIENPNAPTKRTGGRRPTRDDKLSVEEEGRRYQRRERNKQAAARCRKRRLDQTNRLQDETDDLEDTRCSLQDEIHLLQQQKDELEFLLAAHKTSCKRGLKVPVLTSTPSMKIKNEPAESEAMVIDGDSKHARPQRPTSLAVGPLSRGVSELGITIETPSTALRGLGLNFESMMEGGTGLTPVTTHTGLTPLMTPIVTAPPLITSISSTQLNTPIVTSSNCSSQQRSSSSDLSSPESSPAKLVSL